MYKIILYKVAGIDIIYTHAKAGFFLILGVLAKKKTTNTVS
jgi:hypothetical protein